MVFDGAGLFARPVRAATGSLISGLLSDPFLLFSGSQSHFFRFFAAFAFTPSAVDAARSARFELLIEDRLLIWFIFCRSALSVSVRSGFWCTAGPIASTASLTTLATGIWLRAASACTLRCWEFVSLTLTLVEFFVVNLPAESRASASLWLQPLAEQ